MMMGGQLRGMSARSLCNTGAGGGEQLWIKGLNVAGVHWARGPRRKFTSPMYPYPVTGITFVTRARPGFLPSTYRNLLP